MSDPFLDHLPSAEQEKVRKRLRSPGAYEKLRQNVKGPEDLEKELAKAERLADASLEMETNPEAKEQVKKGIEKDLRENGIENVLEKAESISPAVREQLTQGKFTVAISPDDGVSVLPEGNVTDRLPVKPALSDQYVTRLSLNQQ